MAADPIITPRRREDFFDAQGNPTIRFISWIELVTNQTNTTTIITGDNEEAQVIAEARAASQASIFNQQRQHDKSDNRIETLEVKPQVSQASIVRQQQQTNALGDRLETVEIDLSTRPRSADIFRANQRIDELIDELIKEIRAIAPDVELENKALSLQVATLQQLKLLNLRTEEAFETDLNEEDI